MVIKSKDSKPNQSDKYEARDGWNCSLLMRRWSVCNSLIVLTTVIAFFFLMGSDLMGQRRSDTPLPDFTVDTAQGKYTFSEHRGKTLVYFFAFPG